MAAASGKTAKPSTADLPRCGAHTRSGGLCKLFAGKGTDHPGFGHCKYHTGSTPSGRRNAAKLEAVAVMTELGAPVDIDPHDALIACVHYAHGEVLFWRDRIRNLDGDSLLVQYRQVRDLRTADGGNETSVTRSSAFEVHIYAQQLAAALDRLARFSKMAIDAGVAERAIRVAEFWAERLALMLEGVLGELQLTPAQRELAPAAVARQLTLLEGGKAAA